MFETPDKRFKGLEQVLNSPASDKKQNKYTKGYRDPD
jgi:hypothetical protein